MKTFLPTLLLLGACFGAGAQGANDPFFNTGYARSMNSQIQGGAQPLPAIVANAVTDLQHGDSQKAQLVSYLKNHYGYVVWDRGIAFTSHGNPTALIPMVFSEGSSISGVFVIVQQGAGLHYGVMDLVHPFPFVSNAANVEGLPGVRSILATFAYFNHQLFGHANCGIIQALYALLPQNARSAPEDQTKSCYYNIQA